MRGTQIKQADEVRVFAHDAKPVVIGAVNSSAEDGGVSALITNGLYIVGTEITTTTTGSGTGLEVDILSTDAIDVNDSNNIGEDIIGLETQNFSDFTTGTYTGTIGVTPGYTTSGAGSGLEIQVTVDDSTTPGTVGTVVSVIILNEGTGFLPDDDIVVDTIVLGGAKPFEMKVGLGEILTFQVNPDNEGTGYEVGDEISIQGGIIPTVATFTITNVDIPGTENRGVCLYAGATGDISVVMESGNPVTFPLVPEGTFLPILVTSVTSGTDVIALY
jgi:hypothetical protein